MKPNPPPPKWHTERGIRENSGKLPWHLLPWDALSELARVYQRGSEKYTPRNWEKGLSFEETWDSLQRHAQAWIAGNDHDEETKLNHMAHVAWNALALLAFQLRGRTDLDDRQSRKEAP